MSMARAVARLRRAMITVTAVLGGAACQSAPSAPSVVPTTPSTLAASWLNTGETPFQPLVDVGACLSTSSTACFTAPPLQVADRGAEPVTGPPINLTAIVSGTTVTLTWTPPGVQDAPVISYLIDVGSAPSFATPDLLSL